MATGAKRTGADLPVIKKGISTWLGIVSAVALAIKPASEQIIALVENTAVHWTKAEKTSLITGAAVAAVTIVSRAAQAVAHIIGSYKTPGPPAEV